MAGKHVVSIKFSLKIIKFQGPWTFPTGFYKVLWTMLAFIDIEWWGENEESYCQTPALDLEKTSE